MIRCYRGTDTDDEPEMLAAVLAWAKERDK